MKNYIKVVITISFLAFATSPLLSASQAQQCSSVKKTELAAAICLELASLYEKGEAGCEKDMQTALSYYEQAGSAGDISAYKTMGEIYIWGKESIAQDQKKAFQCFQQGAEKGDLSSTCWLGSMYMRGQACEQDGKSAVACFDKVIAGAPQEAKMDVAWKELLGITYRLYADLYYDGIGVEQDLGRYWEYVYKSAQCGDAEIIDYLKEVVQGTCKVSAEKRAEVACFLGSMYETGHGVTKNLEQAFLMYVRAAQAQTSSTKCVEGFEKARQFIWSGKLKKYLIETLGADRAQERFVPLVRFFGQHTLCQGTECSICQEEIPPRTKFYTTLLCYHSFCFQCWNQYRETGPQNKNCPVCREKWFLG